MAHNGVQRVVHLITGLQNDGAQTMLWKILRHRDHRRVAASVISLTSRGALGDRIEALGVPVIALGMHSGFPGPVAVWHLIRELRRLAPDVLQTWLPHSDLVGLVTGRIAHIRSIVWNVRCADLDPRDHPRSLRWTMRVLALLSPVPSAVVVNSRPGQIACVRLGYRPKRWVLISNGFDLDSFAPAEEARRSVRAELEVPPDAVLVGLIARFHPMKDHRTFFQAGSILHASHPSVQFVLVGRGVDEANAEIADAVKRLGLSVVTHLLGERQDIPRLTAALDVATCCSYSEGFPNVIGEAMACGVPCVTTDIGDCAALVGDSGIVVPTRDPDALAQAWQHLVDLPVMQRIALGRAARVRVGERFDIGAITRRYEALYAELSRLAS